MAGWIILILLSAFFWSICSVIDRFVISKDHIKSPIVYSIFNGITGFLAALIILPFSGFSVPSLYGVFIALISGMFYVWSVIPYYKACRYEEISRVTTLLQITPVFVLISAFFVLGERLTADDLVGFFIILMAGIIVSLRKIKGIFKMNKAFYLIIVSALIATVYSLANKYVFTTQDLLNGFILVRAGAFLGIIPLLFLGNYKKEFYRTFFGMKKNVLGIVSFKALLDIVSWFLLSVALITGPVSLISLLLSSTFPIFKFIIVVFSSLFLPRFIKEDFSVKSIAVKIIAIMLVVTGIWMIHIG